MEATAIQTYSAPTALIPQNISEAVSFSEQMAKANLIPDHLQKKPADCLRVVMQSSQWGMNPFAVADSTSIIHGKLMFEGKLVAAVVNSRGGLSKRLNYKFTGEGNHLKLVVTGRLRGEDEDREITLTYQQAAEINKNGQVRKNPEQQMSYIGARIWARRHMPELMLGVHADDEFESGTDNGDDAGETTDRPKAPAKSGGKKGGKKGGKTTAKAEEPPAEDDAIDVSEVKDEPPKTAEDKGASETQAAAAEDAKAQSSQSADGETTKNTESTKDSDDKEPKAAEAAEDAIDVEEAPTLEVDIKNPKTEFKESERLESVLVKFTEVEEKKTRPPKLKPILVLHVEGPYTGIAYSYDTENPLYQDKLPVIATFKGVKSGEKVNVFVDNIQAAE